MTELTNVNKINGAQLLSLIERIERLNEEKAAISEDIKEIFSEAKGGGFDVKAMRLVIKLRKLNPSERQEQEYMEDLYKRAVGLS